MVEMLNGEPPFKGENGIDQLVEIFKVLGTPTKTQLTRMNPDFVEFKFPQVLPVSWSYFFKDVIPVDALDLVSKLLVYSPGQRLKPIEALIHPFFDELRNPSLYTSPHNRIPNLFDFFKEEIEVTNPEIVEQLVPFWYKNKALERMIDRNIDRNNTQEGFYKDELDKEVEKHRSRKKMHTTRKLDKKEKTKHDFEHKDVYSRYYDTKT